MLDLSGERAIVTGGTRGLGAAITEALLRSGARVTATFVEHAERAEAFRASLPDADRLSLACFDVSDYGAVETFFGGLEAPPQIVVNNAGIRKDQIVGMMPAEDWRRVLSVNLDGTFHVSKLAVMAMTRQRYGRIVNVVSPAARLGFAGQANYAASKAGQVAFTQALAKEVAKRGITVNAVSPGVLDTELLADVSEERRRELLEMIPMKRFGTPKEVASAVLFLVSREASYVTGATLEVTGGI